MVEIKAENYPDPAYQNQRLQDLFSDLTPQQDFHFLSLSPPMFNRIDFLPNPAFLPIAELNVRRLNQMAIRENYGGITGHYLFITDGLLKKNGRQQLNAGTGFVNSKNCLFRELNRGIKWIFSNRALKLKSICDAYQ
jgi:glycerophosphoryl diester phosphodiesterase